MKVSVVWYRARPSEAAGKAIKEMLKPLGAEIIDEQITIKPESIAPFLAKALREGEMAVFVGGLELMRETENLMYLIAGCLPLRLEELEESRCSYIYDTLRGTVLPSFETAVVFPSPNGQPEGSVVSAGRQALLLMPADEEACVAVSEKMKEFLPELLDVRAITGEHDGKLPDYLLRAQAKRERTEREQAEARAASRKERLRHAEFTELEIKKVMSDDIKRAEAMETNRQRAAEKTAKKETPRRGSRQSESLPRGTARDTVRRTRGGVFGEGFDEFDDYARQPKTKFRRHESTGSTGDVNGNDFSFLNYSPIFRGVAVALVLAVIVTAIAAGLSGNFRPGIIMAESKYQSELAALYKDTGDGSGLPLGVAKKFKQLYEKNRRVGGFLKIEGTKFAQPVMVTSDTDADFYTYHDFYDNLDKRGALYFDTQNRIVLGATNENTVIYGKSPSDGSLFGVLRGYLDKEYFSKHEVISFDTLYKSSQYLVFAACIISENTVGEFNYADTDFTAYGSRETYLYNLFIRSLFYTTVDVFPTDNLLTLVTDSDEFDGAKLVVCAREVRDTDDLSALGYVIDNKSVLMPDIWYTIHNETKPEVPRLEIPEQTTTRTETTATTTTTTTTTTTVTTATTTTAPTTASPATTATAAPATTATTTAPPTTAAPAATTTSSAEPTTIRPGGSVSTMRITSNGKVIEKSVADTLAMIVEAEMSSEASLEALKAQAVAAYTFYIYSGGRAKAPSFPTKTAGIRAQQASEAVAGLYMKYGTTVPYTPYYDMSAGKTANNKDINGSELKYLTSVDCSVDISKPGFSTTYTHSAADVAQKVLKAKGIDLTKIPDKSQWFKILERDSNGLYVTKVQVGDKTFRGNTLHLGILGYKFLRSPAFWITYDAAADTFTFVSNGYGTGVGMSQKGADEYAKQGHNYVWILQHFYPGVTIQNYK